MIAPTEGQVLEWLMDAAGLPVHPVWGDAVLSRVRTDARRAALNRLMESAGRVPSSPDEWRERIRAVMKVVP